MTDPSLGVLLFLPYRHMEQRILDAVVAAGYPVTLAQARVFQRVDADGSRLTELAASAQVTKQTAGFLVDQLEAGGYVERVPDPSDARARLIRITDRGHQAVAIARVMQDRIETEWREHLGDRELERLRSILLRLRGITDPWE
ncbi:MarR family winged helix-turn-helix transcriptional regulator [Nocardioides sp. SR21]|uniref:MarR family winged helix-turn-helix transcriptional regulator n=1 Tax=Nocardioides sp. SR21 TaxID=2919501 RepID=UPI001FA9585C|nr:MarR family winged helix-turn-helix transcriptional regulator [Nocardioides sp. SR21]